MPPTLNRTGAGRALEAEPVKQLQSEVSENGHAAGNGTAVKVKNRLPAPAAETPILNGDGYRHEDRPALAMFCYEEPGSVIGRAVGKTAAALGQRQTPVHLFARQPFELDAPGVTVHAVGTCADGDLLDRVQEFTHRACNAFLQQFPNGKAGVTVMAYEWSAVPALSILRGIKDLCSLFSLHSLERQRSDMGSEVSRRIEEIELSGLREARAVLVQQPATAEVARHWFPDCTPRLVQARQPFPTHLFQNEIDAGAVKSRYQVGPIDPTILYVGDLAECYGPDMLIKALPPILKNHKQARLVIVGDGPDYWPLRVYTRYLLLEHAVRLVGSVEGQALCELVQAADVVAVPSRETTPWWPIQAAWAARRPVVATHKAAPGLLEHEQDSVLFYPSENSCVWGIERILFDPELGRAIADGGHRKLEERFGWTIVAEQVEELMGVAPVR
jgi:glycosyltransferase involved in cell wall biosynthesis